LESYKQSLLDGDSYESQNRAMFQPDRIVFINGVLQTRLSGDASYHESLVHPAMFSHVHPRRILIIGGGEGASLREVLKHKSVEEVVMIEEDEQLINLSKIHFPEYSDCSSLLGVPSNCFDDPRVEIVYQDLSEWFVEEFENDKETEDEDDEDHEAPFDVIIMDEK
jgi:spermidine synthase